MVRAGFVANDDGTVTVPIENIWQRVKRWAKRHGHTWDESYGVVHVAAC